jgi:hypothetical protein
MLLNKSRKIFFAYSRSLSLKQLAVILLTLFLSIATWGQTFVQQGSKLVSSEATAFAGQGRAVAISADGNTAIVGASGDSNLKGAAWAYARINGVWSQQGTKLIGTGALGNAIQGFSAGISADGNTAIIGGFGDNDYIGAAWIFKRVNGIWSQDGPKLVGSGNSSTSFQGFSVAISGDGNTVILGGPFDDGGKGASWIFIKKNGNWTQQGNKIIANDRSVISTSSQGSSVALSYDGNTAVVGGESDSLGTGGAWIYKRNGDIWLQSGKKLFGTGATNASRQGWSTSISADGKTVAVGGIGDSYLPEPYDSENGGIGGTWIFTESNGIWTQQGTKLVGANFIGNSAQGYSVSLSGDGSLLLIGGMADNSNLGGSWIFKRTSTSWQQLGPKLIGNNSSGLVFQGISVSLSSDGKTAIIGGVQDNKMGAAWVFTANSIALSINDVSISEDVGTAQLQVCLSEPTNQPVTVQYSPSHGSAKADSDYVAVSGTLTIPAGQTCATIPVTIIDDVLKEGAEDAVFRIFNPTNATIGDAYGAINITDNDVNNATVPTISVSDLTKSEATSLALVNICLSSATTKDVSFFLTTAAYTANSGSDYTSLHQQFTIPAGQTCIDVPIEIINDNIVEPTEGFTTNLSSITNATAGDIQGWVYITDDDSIAVCPTGAICIKNTCPVNTVNLNTAYSIPNLPAGTVVSWHTGTPATDANRLTPAQSQAISSSGSYYAAIYTGTNGCYSATIQVVVTIINCGPNTPLTEATIFNKENTKAPQTIIPHTSVAPNPFTNNVNVIVNADKTGEALLSIIDIYGRQLQSQKTKVTTGKNNVSMTILSKIPPGNYLLKIKTGEKLDVHKLVKQ